MEFVILYHKLEERVVNVSKFIIEFNKAQNQSIDKVRHDVSVMRICYEYLKKGDDVEIYPKYNYKKPDLRINNLYADIKIVQEDDINEIIMKKCNVLEFKTNIGYMVQIDLNEEKEMLIDNLRRKIKGFGPDGQADVYFFDLSYRIHSPFRFDDKLGISTPINLEKNKIILFHYSKYTNLEEPNIKWYLFD